MWTWIFIFISVVVGSGILRMAARGGYDMGYEAGYKKGIKVGAGVERPGY